MFKKKFLLFYTLLLTDFIFSQSLVINEIITSNTNVIMDDDGNYEDWVEIYNNSTESINLLGYGLSDNNNYFKWIFPAYAIQPGEYLLVWCSNKNRMEATQPLHTNFAISSGGETITLTAPNGTVVDQIPAILIPQNSSYGRLTDGNSTFVVFTTPTPGQPNIYIEPTTTLQVPEFSMEGGFYSSSFTITLSHPDPAVTIIYTLDGSEPDENNLSGTTYLLKNQYARYPNQETGELLEETYRSLIYLEPINIVDRSQFPNKLASISTSFDYNPDYIPEAPIFKGTVVRAKAIKSDLESSKIVTKNYFITPEAENRYSLPVIALSINEDLLFDYELGTNNAGKLFDEWRINNPDLDADSWSDANYWRGGDEWELRSNFSYFVNGEEVLNQDVGFRNHGNSSRSFRNRSWRLYARSAFSSSSMDYRFFPDQDYNSFKRLILRNSGNDTYKTMFRDAIIQQMFKHLNFETQAYQPAIVFLNSEYWGIFNIRERFDKHYFKRIFDINDGELDYLENNALADEGDNIHYLNMIDYITNNHLSSNESYQHVTTLIDVENYTDYFIASIYAANYDWPHNNIEFWRKRTSQYEPDAPAGQDGRWRWVMKDMDMAFNGAPEWINDSFSHNTLEHSSSIGGEELFNPEWSTLLFRKLLENDSFKNNFINRFADLLNTSFLPSRLHSFIDEAKNILAPEIQEHINRWETIENITTWNNNIEVMKDFTSQRPVYQRSHIREKFNIPSNINAYLFVNDATQGYIKINTIDIVSTTPGVTQNPYPWNGVYFKNIPVTLKANPLPGYEFSHWSGTLNSTDSQIIITPAEDFSIMAHFIPSVETEGNVIYYWLFDNNVPNDTPLTSLIPSYQNEEAGNNASLTFQSCLTGYPFINSHPNWRKASMERRNSPTDINYLPEVNQDIEFNDSNMRGIQIKQPFKNNVSENALVFNVPTTNYKDIVFNFVAKNEAAAEAVLIEYTTEENTPIWKVDDLSAVIFPLTTAYQLFEIDFSAIPETVNNPNLKIRLRFQGNNLTADNGNRVTFNNISVKGTPVVAANADIIKQLDCTIFPNPVTDILHVVHPYDTITFKLFSVDGKLILANQLDNFQIKVQELPKGVYFLQLQQHNLSLTKKIIKN